MMRTLRELEVKRLVVAALLVPLLLFSFFSVHTMPRFTQQGMDIIICTGIGVETVALGDDGDPADQPAHSPCDWSMQIHAAALPVTGIAVEPVVLGRTEVLAFEKVILRSGRLNSSRHARAPPVSV
tara:strand:- start:332 stop:709 length:378 start_codon:yes stop_codon:yes gene_type:complete